MMGGPLSRRISDCYLTSQFGQPVPWLRDVVVGCALGLLALIASPAVASPSETRPANDPDDKDQSARALAGKLLTYATGAAPTTADQPEIETIVRNVRDQNYGLRSLVHEIVQSKMFQSR